MTTTTKCPPIKQEFDGVTCEAVDAVMSFADDRFIVDAFVGRLAGQRVWKARWMANSRPSDSVTVTFTAGGYALGGEPDAWRMYGNGYEAVGDLFRALAVAQSRVTGGES